MTLPEGKETRRDDSGVNCERLSGYRREETCVKRRINGLATKDNPIMSIEGWSFGLGTIARLARIGMSRR